MQIYRLKTTFRITACFIILAFTTSLITPPMANAQTVLNLPQPGTMITVTPNFIPTQLIGITVNPENPFRFNFIVDTGSSNEKGEELKKEANKLIRYFLATMTIPEEDLWVNLSPYEKDRIIPDAFGKTEMGRDLLAQDYILKQLTASLMYPEDKIGDDFWKRVYKKANELYGTTEIPVNTFNKVWIVPDKAVVQEHNRSVIIVSTHLRVMLEEDYLATSKNLDNEKMGTDKLDKKDIESINNVSSSVIREVLIPEIEKEVNEGEHFASLRQIYNSMVLATWYKKKLKNSPLNTVYADQRKVKGIEVEDKEINQKIYNQYIEAFRRGVYNYIKEDYDEATQEIIPRKYFSGGMDLTKQGFVQGDARNRQKGGSIFEVDTGLQFDSDQGSGGTMGRWSYTHTSLDREGKLTLHNAVRIPRKDGVVEEEFFIDGKNSPRDIVLKTRRMDRDEITKVAGIEKELGMSITPRVIIRDVSAIQHRIFGVASQGIPFIREDIIDEGDRDQIKEAFDHENRELTDASHENIRQSQYQGYLRELIRSLSDKDKSTNLSRVGAAFSGKLRTFQDFITTSLGSPIESIQEIELFAMWALYLSELDRTFVDASDFRQAYQLFYEVHEKHWTEGRIVPKSVKAYVPIVRRPFSSVNEIKNIVDVDTEWSIDFLPAPDSWKGPSLYGFILSVVGGQLHMSFYDSNGLIREFNTDEETETALRTIGLIGNEGLVVLVRSSFIDQLKGHAVPGIGSRISLGGHSHPKESGVQPSETRSLGNPADVELFALRLMGLPQGYPVNKDIPALAMREQQEVLEGKTQAPEEEVQTETTTQAVDRPSENLQNMLGIAAERLESFAGSDEGKESPLPINELVLYLKVLQAMYGETIGTYEGSEADHEYVHSYRAEFAGELAYHPRFQGEARRMLEESLKGAFRVLAEQIPGSFMEEPGSLSRMMSVVSQLIEETASHPEFRARAVELINDPRTYGLGDIVLSKEDVDTGVPAIEGKPTAQAQTSIGRVRGLIESVKQKITGQREPETQPVEGDVVSQTTDIVKTDETSRATAIAARTKEFAIASEGLFKAAKKEKSELPDDLKPRPEDVVRARASRLLVLADRSANDDPEIAEAALREYLRLVKKFGDKIDFYVAVTLDRHENIMNSEALRPALIETVRSVPDTEDRNNMLTRIAIQLIDEGDIQGALDLLEEIGHATYYVYKDTLERLADLLLTPKNRNEKMVQQLERIMENVPVATSRGRYDERKIGLFVKLGDKYDELGMRGKANANYKEAWELSARAEQPAVTRLEFFAPLIREKGLKFAMSREDIIAEARRIGESEITRDRLSGRPDTLIAIAREHAFNRDYEKAEEVAQFINDNMDYPRDHYDHCYGAIIEAAALYGDTERIGPAVSKMTHYVKDHFERAAQLLVNRGEYVKAMELANFAMEQGYMGSSTVGYWGSTQVRIARSVLKKDGTQIEMVRDVLGKAITRGGIDDHDLEQMIDMIVEHPDLDPDGQFTLKILQAGFERNRSIIAHKGQRVILKKLREIIMARVQNVNPSLRGLPDVYRQVNRALPAPQTDEANKENVDNAQASSPGGIDMHSKWLDLQAEGKGETIIFNITSEQLQDLQIQGITPYIFNITPLPNLVPILGKTFEEESSGKLSSLM